MSNPKISLTWPIHRLNEAVDILIQKSGFTAKSISKFDSPENFDDKTLNIWFEDIACQSGIESVAVESKYGNIEDMILNAGPAIIRITKDDKPCFLVILRGGLKNISLITSELNVHKVNVDVIKKYLCHDIETPAEVSIDNILNKADISDIQKKTARLAMLKEKLKSEIIGGVWIFRLSPGSDFFKWICHLSIPKYFFSMIICEFIFQILMIISWIVIGKMIIQFSFDWAYFTLWALLLLSVIPFYLFSQWSQYFISMNTGTIFKQRLLFGAMHLKQDEIRNQGPGQFLGRIMESEAFESMAFDGGFYFIIFIIKIIISLSLLIIGSGWLISTVLILWIILCLIACVIYYHNTNEWVSHFRDMTNNMIERMVGYRTRIVQEKYQNWHDEEDIELNKYHQLSIKKDNITLIINPVITRGWMLVSIICIYLSKPDSIQNMIITLGGIIIAFQGISILVNGIASFVKLLCSWQQFNPLFNSAKQYKDNIPEVPAKNELIYDKSKPMLDIKDISYQYVKKSNFKLKVSSLEIFKGDRILLEGPSGGGKSTLSSILSGIRKIDKGMIFLNGQDQKLIGYLKWRRNIVLSPQFHENFVFTGSFAFNLLMGRTWPPDKKDMKDTTDICYKLGLNKLLEKMPEGFEQMIGESGWQLSHGEQSRLFIARALLQNPQLLIFDESFMPLDSDSFEKSLDCVLENDAAIIIVAHL